MELFAWGKVWGFFFLPVGTFRKSFSICFFFQFPSTTAGFNLFLQQSALGSARTGDVLLPQSCSRTQRVKLFKWAWVFFFFRSSWSCSLANPLLIVQWMETITLLKKIKNKKSASIIPLSRSSYRDLVLIILSKKNVEEGFKTTPSAKVGVGRKFHVSGVEAVPRPVPQVF